MHNRIRTDQLVALLAEVRDRDADEVHISNLPSGLTFFCLYRDGERNSFGLPQPFERGVVTEDGSIRTYLELVGA